MPPAVVPAANAGPAVPAAAMAPIGPATPPPTAEQTTAIDKQSPKFSERSPRYQLQPGDTFEVVFTFTPDLNQMLTVQPDGFISLKDIGDMNVKSKTIPEATSLIKAEYSKILHDPQIAVVPKDFEKPHIVVGGQVGKPGKYELRADTTVSEAVQVAGGLLPSAKHSQVLLYRRVSEDWVQVTKLDLKGIYKGDFKEDVHLRPGDMLFVPQNAFSKIRTFIPSSGISMRPY